MREERKTQLGDEQTHSKMRGMKQTKETDEINRRKKQTHSKMRGKKKNIIGYLHFIWEKCFQWILIDFATALIQEN